ncbi:proline permease [Xylariaceae sp. FL0662B]|nr:proline permease [Xylariaceae sp. FL0662B]
MDTKKDSGDFGVSPTRIISHRQAGVILSTSEHPLNETKRGLSPRHVQLMAIGGSIGTGLWVGIGSVLSTAGPLSLILGYAFWGLLYIWPLNLGVAEMCAYLPIRGTIFELASRFVDPALGFAMGWTYFFAGTMLVCVEWSAVATVMQYWVPDINPAAWIAMALGMCYLLNIVAVKWYGESEFIMASTKVLLLFGLCLLTLITMSGGNPQHDAYGFRNWGNGEAMHAYYTDGATGRFLGWWKVVIYAGFTIAGPDMIALAAGEIQNPRRTIPRVAKLIFYRLVGFYVVGVLCVGILCSSRDPRLLGAIENSEPGAAASPWVIGITNLGIKFLPDLINALILLSGWSCGNAYLYSASRTLYGLARDGQAPKFFAKCTKDGVPVFAVSAVAAISCITFLVSSNNAAQVFFWFVDLTTTALIMAYTMMIVAFVGFWRARTSQGMDPATLPYRAMWAPCSTSLALLLGVLALLFVGFDTFVPFDTRGFITNYFALAFGIFMYLVWKVARRTSYVSPRDADLISGKREIDEECKHWEEGGIEVVEKERLAHMNFVRRFWELLW